MQANSVLATVGNTPHMRINRLFGATCRTHQIDIKDRSKRYLSIEGFLP